MSSYRNNHIQELDGLRGIAIIMVICYHTLYWSVGSNLSGPISIFIEISRIGWTGVDLFFVLSGFLITSILIKSKEKKYYYKNFYISRSFRILPLYWMTLIFVLILIPNSIKPVLFNLGFLANISSIFGVPMVFGVTWSLAVEEQFYILWPFVVRSINIEGLSWICFVILLLEPLLRLAGHALGEGVYFYTWFRLDGLALGALVACLNVKNNEKVKYFALMAIVLPVLTSVAFYRFGIMTRKSYLGAALQLSIVSLFYSGIVSMVLVYYRTFWLKPLRSRFLVWTGEISYALYLVHFLVLYELDKFWPKNNVKTTDHVVLDMLTTIIISYFIADLSRRYYDGPLNSYKKKLLKNGTEIEVGPLEESASAVSCPVEKTL